jgi:hypothetical protein
MVMLKAMRSYHAATGDERVLGFMTDYFRYQQRELPEKPLGHWTWWGRIRGGENQESIHWLYNRTGDDFLLDLAQTVFDQTQDWTHRLTEEQGRYHGVNVAMGLKQPALGYLMSGDEKYLRAVADGLDWLMREHGQPQGMYGADEWLSGTAATRGAELCTVVELMYSLQALTHTTGDVRYMDHLERVAYNALPTQHKDDYMGRQYYQQPNQVRVTEGSRNFVTRHGEALCYGLATGYPCCTTNMHQGWPKYARNLWAAAADAGWRRSSTRPAAWRPRSGRRARKCNSKRRRTIPSRTRFAFRSRFRRAKRRASRCTCASPRGWTAPRASGSTAVATPRRMPGGS